MHRRLQFGMREDPASDRRHGSRRAGTANTSSNSVGEENTRTANGVAVAEPALRDSHPLTHAAPMQAAAVTMNSDGGRLLSIRDVAELLQVPVSWVYEHTRHRCPNRIPGIRLGKYWRFQRTEVAAWIEAHRRKDYTRVG